MTNQREVDEDFAEYVHARQHRMLQAAFLVCGDAALAEEVTESALGALLLRWPRVRDDDPDTFVRRLLHGAALSRRVRRGDTTRGGPELPPELAELSARQRAAAVLLRFEERTEVEAAEALGVSIASLRHHLPPITRDQLLDAAAPVAEVDFVDRARHGAHDRRRHRRRRWLGSLAGVAVLAGAVAFVPRGPGGTAEPPPAPMPTSSEPRSVVDVDAAWDPTAFELLGTLAQVGPTPEQLAVLPRIDDLTRGQLALPDVLSFGPRTAMRTLSEVGGSSAPVRAVLLRNTPDGLRAVLVRPTLSDPFVLVDSIPLVANVDEGGNESAPLEVKAIADDRRHVMFIQPGRVIVLDAFTADVRTIPVPDRYLEQGGWVGASVIAWSETIRWRIVPGTGDVDRLAQAAYPGRHQVSVRGGEAMRILTFGRDGANTGTRGGPGVLMGVWGATFTGPDDRFATGGFLGQAAALAANQRRPDGLFQGVFAAAVAESVTPRLLIAPGSEGVAVGCCEVLGWVYRDQVLVRWNTTDLLAWNTSTGALLKVATLPGARGRQGPPVPGSPANSVAIAP
ncbi:sigma-70 family RNA polymerase sigma factor [Knoellia locipacati]|uniref:hypothetical protein n=1 Tax=Knoellia locipacati TaxID=882824 RepID=UPI003851745A